MAEQEQGYPSDDLDWDDLDHALLVVVVNPLGHTRMWAEDSTGLIAHAALLRSLANRLDPPPSPDEQVEAGASRVWDHFQTDRHHGPGCASYVSWADSPEQHRPWWRSIAAAALGQ